jgi:hypothetical protein
MNNSYKQTALFKKQYNRNDTLCTLMRGSDMNSVLNTDAGDGMTKQD